MDDNGDFSCSIKIYARPRPPADRAERIFRAADAIAYDWSRERWRREERKRPPSPPPTTRAGHIRVTLLGAMRRVVW